MLGGIRSGKSRWAEAVIGTDRPVRYLATSPTLGDDPDWADRVQQHRSRRPSHWSTLDTVDVAPQLRAEQTATLVDDMGGWLTAVLDRHDAWSGSEAHGGIQNGVRDRVDDLVEAVRGFGSDLAMVSPEVGLTVVPRTPAGRRFADELGALNQRLAAVCDRVVLVIAGQPMTIKEPS